MIVVLATVVMVMMVVVMVVLYSCGMVLIGFDHTVFCRSLKCRILM